jgi:excisionase family DNA binding protein
MTDAHDASDLVSTTDAARLAGVSYPTLTGWTRSGYLPAVRIGNQRYVRRGDLARAQQAAHLIAVIPAWRADPRHAGQRLRSLREAAGLRQLDLSAASGVPHETISRLERGTRLPQADTVSKLARALDVAPQQVVSDAPTGRLTLLPAHEAARQLGVPRDRLHRWLREGVLPGTKVSGEWRIPAIAVTELDRSDRLRGQSRRLDPRYRG